MTDEQKSNIINFRLQGMTYSVIAHRLNLSLNTVKSFYRRIGQNEMPENICKQCGIPLIQPKGAREKKFCSDKCRMLWWKIHNSEIKKKAVYDFKCESCGRIFQAYGNSHRKYCGRECYIKGRFGGNADEQSGI